MKRPVTPAPYGRGVTGHGRRAGRGIHGAGGARVTTGGHEEPDWCRQCDTGRMSAQVPDQGPAPAGGPRQEPAGQEPVGPELVAQGSAEQPAAEQEPAEQPPAEQPEPILLEPVRLRVIALA